LLDEEKRKFEVLSTRLELSNKLICVGFPGSESITNQTSGMMGNTGVLEKVV
jgi:hypothetical protein